MDMANKEKIKITEIIVGVELTGCRRTTQVQQARGKGKKIYLMTGQLSWWVC